MYKKYKKSRMKRVGKQIKDNNFKEKLIPRLSDLANNMQKDPYIFNLSLNI